MTDPLQYLRDRQGAAIPRAPLPTLRRAPPAAPPPAPAAAGFGDPGDLPALALALLGDGAPSSVGAPRRFAQRCALPNGERVNLPIRYYDARAAIAEFALAPERARAALAPLGLQMAQPVALYGCFEYRDSDLGPYNEVGLSIPALAPGDSAPALYVLHLPVTTAATDALGRALWGYPKFVAGIDIRSDGRAFSTTLADPAGATIAVFAGSLAPGARTPPTDLPTFSRLNGQTLRTRIEALTPFEEGDGSGFTLTLGASSHPMTQSLRALGLDGARPRRVRYAEPFQALLFPGFPV